MGKVEKFLIVRVGMDGGHQPALDAEIVLNDFRKRGKTIRRARSVGNDVVFRGIVTAVVDTEHNRDVFTLAGAEI